MIHTLLRSAAVAAALLTFATAQESQPSTGSGQRLERPHPKPKREPGSQPAGETRPNQGGEQLPPRERAKRYLDAHPEVKQQLFEQADANDDGKLDESERETMRKLVEAKMQEAKEERTEAREEMEERADRNGDGTVDQTERQRAQDVRQQHRENAGERADRNGDGTVDQTERQRAQDVRQQHRENARGRADRNDDGSVDRTERQRAQEVRENRQGTEGTAKPKPKPRQRDGG